MLSKFLPAFTQSLNLFNADATSLLAISDANSYKTASDKVKAKILELKNNMLS